MNSGSLAAMGYYAAEEDRLRRERQEQSNPIDAIGKTALAAGAIAAAILGGRRLSRGTKAEPRTDSNGVGLRNTSATVDLSKVDTNAVRRAAGRPPVDITETVVPSRTPPPVERAAPRTNVERLGDVNEFVRQAREERPQGIKFVDFSTPRTLPDLFTGEEKILTPFGSPTVPTVRSQGTSERGTRLLSPAAPDAVDRLLDDPYILSRVNKEYNIEQEAKELAVDNLLSSNRAEQARQQAQKRRSLTESGDEIISSLRSEANTAQAAAQGDFTQQYLKTAGYKDVDTMVDQQVANVPRNTDQTLNAIDAAEDQQTGRVYQQLQRNEDIDLNQVEILEDMQITDKMRQADREAGYEIDSSYYDRDQGFDIGEEDIIREAKGNISLKPDAPINQVASQLPDGLPVDQAEGLDLKSGRRYETYDEIPPMPRYKSSILNPVTESYRSEINRLQREVQSGSNTEYVFNPPPEEAPKLTGTSAVRFMEAEREKISRELADKGIAALPRDVEVELSNRLGPKASGYGPDYTARAQAMDTVARTGDPIAAETIKKFGLQPVTFETSNDPNLKPVTSYLKAGLFEYPISDIIPNEANSQHYLASKTARNMPVEKQRLFNTRAPMSLEGYPSEDLQVAMNPTGIMVNAPGYGVVDIVELRKPVIMGSTARQADDFINKARQNKAAYIEDFTSKIEGLKQEIYGERRQLAEQTGMALKLQQEQARARGQGNTVRKLETQIQTLRDIYSNPELAPNIEGSFSSIGRHRETGRESIEALNARLRGAEKKNLQQMQALEKKYPTTLVDRTGEAARIFGEVNVDTGELIPETMEVRSGRPDVDLGRRGGGGRNIAEYVAGARSDYSRGTPGTPPLFKRVGGKLVLVKPAGSKSNIRDYDIETGGTADSFESDRTDTVSRAYTAPRGSREVLLYPTTETLIPARSQGHQKIPGQDVFQRVGAYVTSLIGRKEGLQGPPLAKVLPTFRQYKGEIGSGSTIDHYGIRPDLEIVAHPEKSRLLPSQPIYTREEIKNEIARADEPIRYEEAVRRLGAQPATEVGRQSINASEEIRRIQRDNPPAKAQALVSSFLQQLKGV
jgi:hypothetical protein